MRHYTNTPIFKKAFLCLFFILITFIQFSQGQSSSPSLQLTGSGPSVNRGNIDTQLLTSIIQQKQEEVKQHVFRNLIIDEFNKASWTKDLRNFTTYHFIYELMDNLTSAKSKSVIANNLTTNSAEFAYVIGLALYIQETYQNEEDTTNYGNYSLSEKVFESAQVAYNRGTIENSDRISYFNLLVDMCYDVILNDTTQTNFDFKKNLTDSSFVKWYRSDNVYQQALTSTSNTVLSKANLEKLHKKVQVQYTELLELKSAIENLSSVISSLSSTSDSTLLVEGKQILNQLEGTQDLNIWKNIASFITKHNLQISQKDKTILTDAAAGIGAAYLSVRQLIKFYTHLKKSNFTNFSLTQAQYNSLKYIITQFITLAKNQFKNNVISGVLNFMLENTIVQFQTDDGNTKFSADSTTTGYLYIDVESLITSIEANFAVTSNTGYRVYVQPFFSIGINYGSFSNNNQLLTPSDSSTASLNNLYYASEKIGVRWKIWNWGYTHSFDAGQQFEYYGKQRYWKRPQATPLISDLNLIVYGSGLLYNVVNLKSEENFNEAIAGAALGVTFFNGLAIHAGVAIPVTGGQFKSENVFFNLGFDIPIIDYINAASQNN